MPAKSIFVNAYRNQTNANATDAEINRHLVWIKRFYLGSVFYPMGWDEMMHLTVHSTSSQNDKRIIKQKLTKLGIKICIEWAKDNSVRRINSSNVAVWGNALRTSTEKQQQLMLIENVETDVELLLAGTIIAKQITTERYYPQQDYDNF